MFFESLEGRQLMSVTLNANGSINIVGSDLPDTVSIRKSGAMIQVEHNGAVHRFDAAKVKRVNAALGGGDDVLAAHGSIGKRMNVEGGTGDDDIRTGAGDDRIDGGAGADRISSGFGSDTLIGGAGSDVIDAVSAGWSGRMVPLILTTDDAQPDLILADRDGARDEIRHHANDQVHADRDDVRKPVQFPILPGLD
jgi:hypothetical protein